MKGYGIFFSVLVGLTGASLSAAVDTANGDKAFFDFLAANSDVNGKTQVFQKLIKIKGIEYDEKVRTEVNDNTPVVLFIPNDTVFKAWESGEGKELVDAANDESPTRLKRVLKYHVYLMGGTKEFTTMPNLLAKGSLAMASGDTLTINSETGLKDGAGKSVKVLEAYAFKHGHIFIIDQVLIPE